MEVTMKLKAPGCCCADSDITQAASDNDNMECETVNGELLCAAAVNCYDLTCPSIRAAMLDLWRRRHQLPGGQVCSGEGLLPEAQAGEMTQHKPCGSQA